MNLYAVIVTNETGKSPFTILSGFHIFGLLVAAVYFYPMLFVIRKYAKQAGMKKLSLAAQILIVLFSLWLAMNVGMTILAIVCPGLF